MNDVLRVLGIVAAGILLGLVGLFLLLFTICGGLESSDGAPVLAVCLPLIAGAVAAIVVLGRGLAGSRATARGLAVAPAGAPLPHAGPVGAIAAAPYTGTDLQVLIGLRIALVAYVLLGLGSMVLNVADYSRYGSAVAIQLVARNLLALLPPAAVLVALTLRNPPAPLALDAAAGLGIASILFRFGMLAVTSLFAPVFSQATAAMWLLRLGAFSAIEAVFAGMAIHLRSRGRRIEPVPVLVATIAFLAWHGLVQLAMQALMAMLD